MSLQIEVPLNLLQNPEVAQRVADLVRALAGQPAAKPSYRAPVAPAPKAEPKAEPEVAAVVEKAEPSPVAAAMSTSAYAAPVYLAPEPKAAKEPKAAPAPVAQDADDQPADLAERWARYLAELPEPSRRFLEVLEKRGQMTVDEAVEILELPGPKAMGGLTGAMRRWAPKKGVELPFQAITDPQNRRAWVWTGIKG